MRCSYCRTQVYSGPLCWDCEQRLPSEVVLGLSDESPMTAARWRARAVSILGELDGVWREGGAERYRARAQVIAKAILGER